MLFIHTAWCPKCKSVKPEFADQRVVDLSSNFVMVELNQDNVPDLDERYKAMGGYVPRVLFVDPSSGDLMDVKSSFNANYPYFVLRAEHLVDVMKKAA